MAAPELSGPFTRPEIRNFSRLFSVASTGGRDQGRELFHRGRGPDPSNPLSTDAQGNLSRVLPEGQSSGEVVAGWLPTGVRLAMAFGTLSADLLESSTNRSPEPAVLFYATDDDRAGEQVEHLIRTAGFAAVKVGGIEQTDRLGWGAIFITSSSVRQRRGRWSVEPDCVARTGRRTSTVRPPPRLS